MCRTVGSGAGIQRAAVDEEVGCSHEPCLVGSDERDCVRNVLGHGPAAEDVVALAVSTIDAQEAVDLGLVTQIAEAAELDAQITALAGGLRERSARVLAEIRDFLRVTDQATEAQATEMARSRLVVGSLRRGRD